MHKIDFIKMHGLGNDFVIIDKRFNSINITKNIINKLSDRKSGAGCDQLITISASAMSNIDAKIEIFNPSGDKAEACGNGTRCVAKLLFKETNKKKINIMSDAGILNATKNNDGNISVNLGKISTDWEKIPLAKNIDSLNIPLVIEGFSKGIAVNIGNPHIVFIGKNIDSVDLNTLGPKIENNKLFPNKINVEVIEIINKNKIKMRVWERGAGLTKACGTAACATAIAGYLKNLTNRSSNIKFKEGILNINFDKDENIFMTGPVSEVKKIEVNI